MRKTYIADNFTDTDELRVFIQLLYMKTNNHSTILKLRSRLISHALLDPVFQLALSEALSEITAGAKTAENEATIESLFERVLYALLKQIGLSFSPEKEKGVNTKRHIGRGRTDSRIGAVIIEFKHRTALKTRHDQQRAVDQLSGYAEAISKEYRTEIRGVITDGTNIFELSASNGHISSTT